MPKSSIPKRSESVFSTMTPAGRGAIATIGCHGKNVLKTVASMFKPFGQTFTIGESCHDLLSQRLGSIVYGNWVPGREMGEDLIVLPKSNEWVEVHCHGGSAAVKTISNSLVEAGLLHIESLDFARRLAQDPWVGDIDWAIGQANTLEVAKTLLRQRALIPRFVDDLRNLLEAEKKIQAIEKIEAVLRYEEFGKHLLKPWSVVLCGHPNVGKSSLINAICGFDRAIVHSTPGTTRDVVTQVTAVKGWPIEIADTAGMRKDSCDIESQGIELAQQRARNADLVIAVFDCSLPWSRQDEDFVETIKPGLIVHNKMDLPCSTPDRTGLSVSAINCEGVSELCDQIANRLVPEPPNESQAICFSDEQFETLRLVLSSLSQGRCEKGLKSLQEHGV